MKDLRDRYGHENVHNFVPFNKKDCRQFLQYKKNRTDSKMPDNLEQLRVRCREVMNRPSPVPSPVPSNFEGEPLPPNNTNVEEDDNDEQDAPALFIGDTEGAV